MRTAWSQIGNLWCKLTHDDLMWPAHGYYRCRTCLRRHPVPWEHTEARPTPAEVPLRRVHSWSRA